MNEYLAETEVAMTRDATGEFLFDDLRELANKHAQQKLEFEKLIPDNISIGVLVVRILFAKEYPTPIEFTSSLGCLQYSDSLYFSLNAHCERFPTLVFYVVIAEGFAGDSCSD